MFSVFEFVHYCIQNAEENKLKLKLKFPRQLQVDQLEVNHFKSTFMCAFPLLHIYIYIYIAHTSIGIHVLQIFCCDPGPPPPPLSII